MDPLVWPRSRRSGLGALSVVFALWLGQSAAAPAAEEIRIGGTGSALGTMQLLADAFARRNPDIKVTVLPSLGSSGGIKAAIQGAIDIGVSSRPLKADERGLGAVEVEYGRTPFVFAVSAKSKASEITLTRLADIYAGKIKSWPDGSQIRVVMRPVGDVDTDLIKSLSPAIRQALSEAEKRPGVPFAVTDQDAADDLEKIPGAVGPTTLSVILSEKRSLKALRLDGVEPTPGNAAAGRYPHHKTMFFVTGGKPSAAAQRFIAFARSGAGREVLARSGHWVR